MKLFVTILDNYDLLPYFLEHYKSKGITEFYLNVFNGDNNPIWNEIKKYESSSIKVIGEKDNLQFTGYLDAVIKNRLMNKYLKDKEFCVICDLDEFYDTNIKDIDLSGCDGVQTEFLDRITEDGVIPKLNKGDDLEKKFPVKREYTKEKGLSSHKTIITHKDNPVYAGAHNCLFDYNVKKVGKLHHFKWHGDVIERMRVKAIRYKKLGIQYEPFENIVKEYNRKGKLW